ncbi:MAG TPA: DMT family transporter [Alphaproteobacteria bacterium]|nr:DMT family transporter [Alphaproteobacteria bacterium]
MLATLGLCWGSNFLAIKVAVTEIPPATLTLGRLAIAAAILLLVLKAKRVAWPSRPRVWTHLAAVAVAGNALPYGLIAWSEVFVDSQLAAILIAATPLLTIILAHLTLADEPLTARRLGGVSLGFAGVVVLIGVDALTGLGSDLLAQLGLLGAASSFAVSGIVARRMPATPADASALGVTGISTLILFPVAAASDAMTAPAPGWAALLAMLWLGVVSTALAMLTYFKLVASAGPTFVSLANYLVPLLALGLGGALLGERPSWNMALALVLILAGVFLTGGRLRQGGAS